MTQLSDQFVNFFHSLTHSRECSETTATCLLVSCSILTAIFAFSTNLTEFFLLTEIALLSFLTIHILARPYKQRIYNVIDPLMIVNMATINTLSWFVFAISTESEAGDTVEGVNALKLMLMYLPLGLLAGYELLLLFQKTGVIRKKFKFGSSEESNNYYVGKLSSKKGEQQRRGACNDEDLFARAEETTHSGLILACGKEGFTLETTDYTTMSEVITNETNDEHK